MLTSSNKINFFLTKRGECIYFPHSGILGQAKEAKNTKINATIGVTKLDTGKLIELQSYRKNINLSTESVFDYASSFGMEKLRQLWKKSLLEKNIDLNSNLSLPVVTSAITHGLSICAYLFVDKNTDVILPKPYWDNYDLIFRVSYGATIKPFSIFKDDQFNFNELNKLLYKGKNKKVLLLNFPHNPTGYSLTKEEVKKLKKILIAYAKHHKLTVIIDDAYFGLYFEENIYNQSLFAALNNLDENILVVKVDGVTKEDFAWGLRVGFLTYGIKNGDLSLFKLLEDKTAGVIRSNISNISKLSQLLVISAMQNTKYKQEKNSYYEIIKKRYLSAKKILSDLSFNDKIKILPFNSGYFFSIECKNEDMAEKIRIKLLTQYNIGVISFGKYIRINFATLNTKQFSQMMNKIIKLLK